MNIWQALRNGALWAFAIIGIAALVSVIPVTLWALFILVAGH